MDRQRVGLGFGARLTPFVRNLLIALVSIFVVQIVLESWMGLTISAWMGLWAPVTPQGSTGLFRAWQPLTALLFNSDPTSALLDWMMIFFFLQPTLEILGRKGTAKLLGTTWIIGALVAMGLAWPGIVQGAGPCLGVTTLTAAMVVAFGMARPDAQLLFLFFLPMRGRTLVLLELAIATLFFLFLRSFESAVAWTTSIAAVAWMWADGSPRTLLLKLKLQWLLRQRGGRGRRKAGRFEVIDGGRGRAGRDDDWVH
jgi:membrane associated rhomboid family serine protease